MNPWLNDKVSAASPLRKKRDYNPLILLLLVNITWLALHSLIGGSFFGSTYYNTYTLQAMAWRDGRLSLWQDFPALELAIYQGEYYVSFPPLPSVILLPFTLLFGFDTPDNLLMKAYTLCGCLLIYYSLKRASYSPVHCLLLSFFFCFGSSLLPLTLNGAVWYHAQVLAFALMIASFSLFCLDLPAGALLCYALSVAARPFNALYALPLFFCYLSISRKAGVRFKSTVKSLLPGICLGLCVAAGLGIYNYVRFGDPLEFGHNYLPEFSFQGGIQFSISHVFSHLKTFLLGLPVEIGENGLAFNRFGFSILIACPAVTMTLIAFISDIFQKKATMEKCVVVLTMLLHLFFLLFHRTFGGFQLGARYAVDVMPYAFFYLMLSKENTGRSTAQIAVYALIFLLMCFGVTQVHI